MKDRGSFQRLGAPGAGVETSVGAPQATPFDGAVTHSFSLRKFTMTIAGALTARNKLYQKVYRTPYFHAFVI